MRLDHLLSKEKERGFEDIFSKENVYDFEKEVFFLLKEEVCYLFFNVLILYIEIIHGDIAQLARAPALQAGGQGFDSLYLHHTNTIQ